MFGYSAYQGFFLRLACGLMSLFLLLVQIDENNVILRGRVMT